MKSVSTYLNFPGNTREAFDFYRSVFGGEFTNVTRYREMGGEAMGLSGSDLDLIANIGLPLRDGVFLMGTDVTGDWGAPVQQGNNMYIALETDSADECDRIFSALSEGGREEMALQRTEWAEKYGSCADRFGVQWMVMYTGSVVFQG